MAPERLHQQGVLFGVIARGKNVIGQVRPVETRDDCRRIFQRELPADVASDLRCSRGREGDDRRRAKPRSCLSDTEIRRPEVMTPLAYAMRFVDCEEADAHVGETRCDVAEIEALRREIQKLDLTARCARETVGNLSRSECAVDEGCRQSSRLESIDLVLHERDQWRHNDCESGQNQGGYLVADRFPASCRENDERVAAREHRLDRHLLTGSEIIVAECGTQRSSRLLHGWPRHYRTLTERQSGRRTKTAHER